MNKELDAAVFPQLIPGIASRTNNELIDILKYLYDEADEHRTDTNPVYLGYALIALYTIQYNNKIAGTYFHGAVAHLAGVLLKINGDYSKAKMAFEDALKIFFTLDEPDAYAVVSGDYGSACFFTGDYKEAVKSLLAAYNSAESLEDDYNMVEWSRGLGYAYNSLGNYDKALAFAGIALTKAKEQKMNLNEIYTVFANVYENLGQLDKSVEKTMEALEESIRNNEHRNIACDYLNIANLYKKMNKEEDAKLYYSKCIEKAKKLDHVSYYISASIGLASCLEGDAQEEIYLDLLETAKANGLQDAENDLLGNLGAFYINNNPLKAIRFLEQSLKLSEKRADTVSGVLDSLNLAAAHLANGDMDAAYLVTEKLVLLAGKTNSPELQWKIYKSHYVNRMLLKMEMESSLTYLEKSIAALDRFLDEIKKDTDKLSFYKDKHLTYQLFIEHYIIAGQYEEAFIQNEILKSKILRHSLKKKNTSSFNRDAVLLKMGSLDKTACYVSFTLTSGGLAMFLYSVSAGLFYEKLDINENYIDEWKSGWESYLNIYLVVEHGGVHLLESLGEKIAEPIAVFCETNQLRKIIFSPDHSLMSVPLHALRLKNRKYLVEQFIVTYLPSVTLLKPPQKYNPGKYLIFSHTGKANDLQNVSMEAGYIAETVPALHISGTGTTLENFKSSLADVTAIHLSCHSTFDEAGPERSAFLFAEPIIAKDIAGLQLDHIQLVFSASCKSAKSLSQGLLEYNGLIRSWLLSGVQNIIGTYWILIDPLSLFFIKEFYRQLSTGNSPALSYQQAILKSMKTFDFQAPFFWAGIVFFETTPEEASPE